MKQKEFVWWCAVVIFSQLERCLLEFRKLTILIMLPKLHFLFIRHLLINGPGTEKPTGPLSFRKDLAKSRFISIMFQIYTPETHSFDIGNNGNKSFSALVEI